jgi:hypothetical protein
MPTSARGGALGRGGERVGLDVACACVNEWLDAMARPTAQQVVKWLDAMAETSAHTNQP